MYKIEAKATDTEEIKVLIEEANRIQSRYAWTGPSLEKYGLLIDFSGIEAKIRRLRGQQE